MIRLLVAICGMGLETATRLVVVSSRPFRDRRGIAAFVGLTGTPFQSGGMSASRASPKRQHARALPVAAADMALVAVPAGQRAEPLVLRPRGRGQRAHPQGDGGGARAEIAGRAWRYLETGVIPEGVRLADA